MSAAYFLLDNENEVIEAIQEDFLAIANAIVGPNQPLVAAHLGEPSAYGDQFPAWVFYRITSSGNSNISDAEEKMLAEEYICQVLVLAPATLPAGEGTQSGRGYAESVTRKGFSAWLDGLAKSDVHSRCVGVARASTASGSHSEFGRAMFWDESKNALWAHSADIRIVL